MKIIVSNCFDCPFSNNDNEYGIDSCNLSRFTDTEISLGNWEQLPKDKRHKDCPISKELTITIS